MQGNGPEGGVGGFGPLGLGLLGQSNGGHGIQGFTTTETRNAIFGRNTSTRAAPNGSGVLGAVGPNNSTGAGVTGIGNTSGAMAGSFSAICW